MTRDEDKTVTPADLIPIDLAALLRRHKVTIRDLKQRTGFTLKDIRAIRDSGLVHPNVREVLERAIAGDNVVVALQPVAAPPDPPHAMSDGERLMIGMVRDAAEDLPYGTACLVRIVADSLERYWAAGVRYPASPEDDALGERMGREFKEFCRRKAMKEWPT